MSSDYWRSYLYAPGNNPKLLTQALDAGADTVVLDLEDAVPCAEKDRARDLVAAVVADRADSGGPAIFVRVNGVESGRCRADLEAVLGPGLTGIRLPKVETPEQVREAASWLDGSLLLDCVLETARGVSGATEIAAAHERVHALVFGSADFAADIDAILTPAGRESFHARSELVLASRAAGLGPPIDGVYVWLDDEPGLLAAAREARTLGFGGKSAIHPRQLPAIHEAFTPDETEVAKATQIVTAYEEAIETGAGVARLTDGSFVDVPLVDRARRTLALAKRLR